MEGNGPGKRARWSTTTFLLAFGFTLFLLLWITSGFLFPLILALSVAILLGPVHERLTRLLGGRRGLAAALMVLATALVIAIPAAVISVRIVKEVAPLLQKAAEQFGTGRLATVLYDAIPAHLQEDIQLQTVEAEFRARLGQLAGRVTAVAATMPKMLGNVLVDASVALFALFVYFARGPRLAHAIVEATPMERRYTEGLLKTIAATIRMVFAASFVTAIIQAVLGWVAFRIVGVPQALALAALMGFCSFIFSLVPLLGSGLVWGPLGISLIIQGRLVAGLFILGWGAVVLGLVDNIVKPFYARGQLRLSPLLVFITLLGGIAVFGPVGALLGPLVAALSAAFLRIWTTEFLTDAEPLPRELNGEGPRRTPLAVLLARLRRQHA